MEPHALIGAALNAAPPSISYSLSRALTELHPGCAVLETTQLEFDLRGFAAAGRCSLTPRPDVHREVVSCWEGEDRGVAHHIVQGWLKAVWEGHPLDIVTVTVPARFDAAQHWFVIGPEQDVVERFFVEVCRFGHELRDQILVFSNGFFLKNEELYRAVAAASFDDIVLPAALATALRHDFRAFLGAREDYARFRMPWKRGALFLGPPGNGKTYCVKALIRELALPCIYVKSFAVSYGTEDSCIHNVFERARRTAPCLIVLEDLDSLLNDRTRAFFLNELDGLAGNEGIVTIATTNHPERLDPAILERPSRFDRKYSFDLPGPDERRRYAELWNDKLDESLRLAAPALGSVAEQTAGFSFAYLKELFLSASMAWISGDRSRSYAGTLQGQIEVLRRQVEAGIEARVERVVPPKPTEL